MSIRAANAYRRVDLESAPKSQIVVRLFERFATDVQEAKDAIAKKDIKGKAKAIDHAMRIVSMLAQSLDREVAPDLCGHLAALYEYVTHQLTQANRTLAPAQLDEAARIMGELAVAFREAGAAGGGR